MSDTGTAIARLIDLCAVEADTPSWLRAIREARDALRRLVGGRGWVFEVGMGECETRVAILRDGFAVTVGPGDPVDARLAGDAPEVASALLGYTNLDDALASGLLTVPPATDLQRLRRIAEIVGDRLRELVAGAAPVAMLWRRVGAGSQRWRIAAQVELSVATGGVAAAVLAVTMMAAAISPLLPDALARGNFAPVPLAQPSSLETATPAAGDGPAVAQAPVVAPATTAGGRMPTPADRDPARASGVRTMDQGQSVGATVEGGTPEPATEDLGVTRNGFWFEVEVYCGTMSGALACAAARATSGATGM